MQPMVPGIQKQNAPPRRETAENNADLKERARVLESERQATLEQRRDHSRRTVLGMWILDAKNNGANPSSKWIRDHWNKLQSWKQDKCWAALRARQGLKPATFGELVRRQMAARKAVREGTAPRGNQVALKKRQAQLHRQRAKWNSTGHRAVYGLART